MQEVKREDSRYNIVRMYERGGNRIIKRNVSFKEALEHCNNPETSSSTCTNKTGKQRTKKLGRWFDCFVEMRG